MDKELVMLTFEDEKFLSEHGFSKHDVFDARKMKATDFKVLAKQEGKNIVLSSSPCRKAGHRLRTRYNHCWQCDPKKLTHLARYSSEGFVYLAYSKSEDVVKIGVTGDIDKRRRSLNVNTELNQAYGAANDWEIVASEHVSDAGRVEKDIQRRLESYSIKREYVREGRNQAAGEVFKCDLEIAKRAFRECAQITE